MSSPSNYFVAGGTLPTRIPSYVVRAADQELYQAALEGEFCYVLTPRQMGKSSLMVRASRRLEEAGATTAMVDLNSIGTTEIDTWYRSLLTQIARALQLDVDVQSWWEVQDVTRSQRFMHFVRDVLLTQTT